jgi:hypothetical protein
MPYAHYLPSGAISSIFDGRESDCRLNGDTYIPCEHGVLDTTHYVELSGDPTIMKKRPLDTARKEVGLEVTFTALPPGLTLRVGELQVITDGDDVVEFDVPGTYTIELSGLVEYLDEALEVTVG